MPCNAAPRPAKPVQGAILEGRTEKAATRLGGRSLLRAELRVAGLWRAYFLAFFASAFERSSSSSRSYVNRP